MGMSVPAAAVRLRAARATDAYPLWIWANDPDMRHAAYDRAFISWADHLGWLARVLHDPLHLVLLAESPDGQPLGAIRFESADGWEIARVSYVVAAEARGQGLARPLVRSGVERLRESRPAARVRAEVRADNARSLRVFRWLGWTEEVAGERGVGFELP
jgi:RimJ/RimL family protein N-acetyltransferase